jgi:cholesterol transport system auxiliary component
MTALRTTRPAVPRSIRARVWVFLAAFGVFGCGRAMPPSNDVAPLATSSPGANDPSWLTSRDRLPAPDTDRIEYDAQKRTLTLYDLPGHDRWMVQLPDEANGRPIGPQHRLPDGVDTTRTLVYYARPGVKVSAAVTIARIEAGRGPHSSLEIVRR